MALLETSPSICHLRPHGRPSVVCSCPVKEAPRGFVARISRWLAPFPDRAPGKRTREFHPVDQRQRIIIKALCLFCFAQQHVKPLNNSK